MRSPIFSRPLLLLASITVMTVSLVTLWCLRASGVTAQTSCVASPAGLVSWWPGDGSSVDFRDSNPGTLVNGATFAPGKVGLGFSLDGVDDRVEIPDAQNLKPSNISVEAWVKFDALDTPGASFPGFQHIAFKKNSRPFDFFEAFTLGKSRYAGNVDRFYFLIASAGGTQVQAISTTTIATGQFYHVVGTYDFNGASGTVRLYVNGVLESSTPANFPLDYGTRPLVVGSSSEASPVGRLKGVIDEFSIYNRALSASEIQAIFNAGSAGKCRPACLAPASGLVSWWPGDGQAVDIQDGNHGTLLGGTFFTPAKVGQGFTFDSDDDRVTIPHNNNLNINSPGFTAEFWMQGVKNQPHELYAVIDKSHSFVDNTGWVFQGVSSTGSVAFAIGAGGGPPFNNFPHIASGDVLDGNLHHIAGTWDGANIRLYVDGVLQGATPFTTPFNNARALNIGFAAGGGTPQRFFRGKVDEPSIFNRALTASEIQAIFNAGSAGKCKPPGVQFDGRGAFVHTAAGDVPTAPPAIVDLGALGFAPGDYLRLSFTAQNFSFLSCNGPFNVPGVHAVFSSSNTLLAPSNFARVPRAIDAGNNIVTPPTGLGNEPTDIPQDFQVFLTNGPAIRIPPGATHLFIGVIDSHYSDNCGKVIVTIERVADDADSDGVIDFFDTCAGTAAGTVVDESGCPAITCSPLASGWNFSERFNGAFDNTWVASPGALPNASGFTYIGAPSYTFETVQSRQTLRMTNTLNDLRRVGFVTDSILPGSSGRLEARINTLTQDNTRVDGLFDLWLVNATDPSKWVRTALFGSHFSTQRRWNVESSLGNFFETQVNYANDTWYRLRIDALPGSLRASLWNDAGTVQIASYTLTHQLAALGSNFRIGIAQYMGTPNTPTVAEITDVAVDYVRAFPAVVANAGPDQTVECQGAQTTVTLNATTSCDPDGDPLTFTWREGTSTLGTGPTLQVNLSRGTHTVTLTVADPGGVSAQDTVIINVVDTTRPMITAPPALNITTGADATACGKLIDDATLGTATASDSCGAVTITRSGMPANNLFPISTTTIIYTATDAGGNTATATQTVTVTDNTLPTITAPPAVTANTGAGAAACGVVINDAALGTAMASDNCGSAPITRSGVPAGNFFSVGTTTITYTATDLVGNVATATQTVTVPDNTAPTLSCPTGTTVSADANCQAAVPNVLGGVTAADNCTPAGSLTKTQSPAAGTLVGLGPTTITVTVTDSAGNTSTCTTILTVVDTTPPTITTCAAPQSAIANASCQAAVPNFTGVTATDNCTASGSLTITQSPAAGTLVGLGPTPVTITVRDAAGNTATCPTSFTVSDQTNPVISNCPPPITVYTGAGAAACSATASWTPPTAADNCGTPTLTSSHTPGGTFPVGTTTVTYMATDGAGNQATCSFTVTVVDNTPAAVSCPAGTTATVNASCLAAIPNVLGSITVSDNCTPAGSLAISQNPAAGTTVGPGTHTITVTVTDAAGNSNTCPTSFTVLNSPPTASAGGPYTVNEGGSVVVAASGSDAEGVVTFAWDLDNNGSFETPGQSATFSAATLDGPSNRAIKVRVTDACGGSTVAPTTVNVANVAPTVDAITAPLDPNQVNTAINASASFTDPGLADTHTAAWNWGDGGTSAGVVTESNGSGSVSGGHTYTTPGVYVVTLTVTDDDTGAGQAVFQYIVIYDPDGGFVTGGGWINSPAEAYVADPLLTGKAHFGFTSRYQKGANVPTGNTQFRFQAGNLDFRSTSYEWMVIAGARAQYKGAGKINGAGDYRFMLTAIDGQQPGGGGQDKFRIRIWDNNGGGLVYDNQLNAPDNDDPTTVLGGGSIVIHR